MTGWWEKQGGAPDGPLGEKNHAGEMGQGLRDGMGIGFTSIAEAGLFPLFVSSPFAGRNFRQSETDSVNVEIDILWAFVISVIVSVVLGYYLQSGVTILWGIGLGVGLSLLYLLRAGILKMPWHVPFLTPLPRE
jgi:hypothetical protein